MGLSRQEMLLVGNASPGQVLCVGFTFGLQLVVFGAEHQCRREVFQ